MEGGDEERMRAPLKTPPRYWDRHCTDTDTDTDILYIGDFRIGFWVLDNALIWASRLDILVYNNSIKVYKKVNKFYEKKKYSFFCTSPAGKKR